MSANLVYYSLDGTIEQFFQDETATRQECDDFAVSLLGSPVRPVSIQGSWSYTVAGLSTDSLVQFRKETAVLDMELVKRARDTYGAFVADCTYHGPVGQSPSLLVYVMEKLPGEPYIQNRPTPKDGQLSPAEDSRTVATVMGFARLVPSRLVISAHSPPVQSFDVMSSVDSSPYHGRIRRPSPRAQYSPSTKNATRGSTC